MTDASKIEEYIKTHLSDRRNQSIARAVYYALASAETATDRAQMLEDLCTAFRTRSDRNIARDVLALFA